MKKTPNIILTIVLIGVLCLIGFLVVGVLAVQDKYEPESIENATKIVKEKNELKTNNNLIDFLETPIDLLAFKEKKEMKFTTSVTNGINYYFNPKIKDSIFYVYYYHGERIKPKEINEIIVFKYGENKHVYDDKTEILIELKVFNKDPDLGKANLVGVSQSELEIEFGIDYLEFNNLIVYSNGNKILIFEIDKRKVKSFNYIKLNTEKIDSDLIKKISR